MDNVMQVFNSDEFGEIRTVQDDGKVLFCGSDVAKALGYAIPSKAVNDHCKGVSKMEAPTKSGIQTMLFITEGDVYRLIASSKLKSAQRFESWVFDDVLPSIRKHGMYATPQTVEAMLADPSTAIKMLEAYQSEQARANKLQAENEAMAPKVLFADAVADCDGTCLIGELAKLLAQNGVEIGQNRLFADLRRDGYLGKSGSNTNVPTQRAMDMGLFRIKETAIAHADGHTSVSRTPKVTGKGQRYFVDRYLTAKKAL